MCQGETVASLSGWLRTGLRSAAAWMLPSAYHFSWTTQPPIGARCTHTTSGLKLVHSSSKAAESCRSSLTRSPEARVKASPFTVYGGRK